MHLLSVPEDALLRAQGLTVRFGPRAVLQDVDLTVRPGEIVTLIGPNGAGKTTLVKAALGLVAPAAGTVWKRPGLRLGYMPQRLQIDPTLPLTVRRFLRLWGRVPPGAAERVLAEVGAAAVIDSPVQALSGGETQRVLLARALLREPDLLVLDEPAQGVDVAGQAELYRLIDRIRRAAGCGVLLVSHDLHLVMAQTDHVVCMNGHVCCEGHPEAVTRHPHYQALFGPAYAASYAVYRHHHDHRHAVGGDIVPLPQREPPASSGPPEPEARAAGPDRTEAELRRREPHRKHSHCEEPHRHG